MMMINAENSVASVCVFGAWRWRSDRPMLNTISRE
jgi:hypothetical protein